MGVERAQREDPTVHGGDESEALPTSNQKLYMPQQHKGI